MSFSDNSFDLCYSYTVMEHVETSLFISEQYRILKPKGTIVIMSVRPGLNVSSGGLPTDMDEEDLVSETVLKQVFTRHMKVLKACQTSQNDICEGLGAIEM